VSVLVRSIPSIENAENYKSSVPFNAERINDFGSFECHFRLAIYWFDSPEQYS